MAITEERLTIDLRPLVSADPVRVEVSYDLSNTGISKKLDLLFISGEAGVSDFEAYIGHEAIKTRPLSSKEMDEFWKIYPRSWQPPDEAPGIETGTSLFGVGNRFSQSVVAFSVELPPAASTLRVRYLAHAHGTAERPTVTWQLPYVLAPAREWGGFGQLNVLVYLPSGWDARSTPALERDGDTLRGSFAGIPADALLIATGAPVPIEYDWAVWLTKALWVIALVGGAVMCWWVGRGVGVARARFIKLAGVEKPLRTPLRGIVACTFPALLWGGLIYALVPLSMGMVRASLHGQENPSFAGPWIMGPCVYLFVMPFIVFLGAGLTFLSASHSARRSESE